jgi:predicted alpha/beta-fold hydrolase
MNIAQYLASNLPSAFEVPIYGKSGGVYNIISQCVRTIPPENPYRRQMITTRDNGTIAVDWLENDNQRRLPEDAPVMLFVHGFGSSPQSDDFRAVASVVQDKFRVVCMVCRGSGGLALTSYISLSSHNPADLGYIIEAVDEVYPRASGYHIFGCSIGGVIATKYLLIDNEKQGFRPLVKSLITACSPLAAQCLSEAVACSPVHEAVGRLMAKRIIDYLAGHWEMLKTHPELSHEGVWREIANSNSCREIQEAYEVRVNEDVNTIEEFFAKDNIMRLPFEKLAATLNPWVLLVAEDDPVIGFEGK